MNRPAVATPAFGARPPLVNEPPQAGTAINAALAERLVRAAR